MKTSYTCFFIFFFNDTATTEIYTLSLHDALPICCGHRRRRQCSKNRHWSERHRHERRQQWRGAVATGRARRSEEHTSELQSRPHLVCRLLLEKKKKQI